MSCPEPVVSAIVSTRHHVIQYGTMSDTRGEKYLIGLTGTIGSGKSFVASVLAELGADIIDTDVIAREVVEPGTEGLAAIVDHWGVTIAD